jgi:hypothetical protein
MKDNAYTIVPAATGFVLSQYESSGDCFKLPVIGWRIPHDTTDNPIPVVPGIYIDGPTNEFSGSYSHWCVQGPVGGVIGSDEYENAFDTFEAWYQTVKEVENKEEATRKAKRANV